MPEVASGKRMRDACQFRRSPQRSARRVLQPSQNGRSLLQGRWHWQWAKCAGVLELPVASSVPGIAAFCSALPKSTTRWATCWSTSSCCERPSSSRAPQPLPSCTQRRYRCRSGGALRLHHPHDLSPPLCVRREHLMEPRQVHALRRDEGHSPLQLFAGAGPGDIGGPRWPSECLWQETHR